MSAADHADIEGDLEQALLALVEVKYQLTLFVSGASPLSARAVANARTLCQAHLAGRHSLSVVDVHSDPALVVAAGVLAVPTLVRELPLPRRRIVGDLSDTAGVLQALHLPPVGDRTA
jgi:circadian clock protein KaiB